MDETDQVIAEIADELLCDVVRSQDGALVIRGVDPDTALSEKHRLNAEARVVVGVTREGRTQYQGMYLGNVVTYEVRSANGVVA